MTQGAARPAPHLGACQHAAHAARRAHGQRRLHPRIRQLALPAALWQGGGAAASALQQHLAELQGMRASQQVCREIRELQVFARQQHKAARGALARKQRRQLAVPVPGKVHRGTPRWELHQRSPHS